MNDQITKNKVIWKDTKKILYECKVKKAEILPLVSENNEDKNNEDKNNENEDEKPLVKVFNENIFTVSNYIQTKISSLKILMNITVNSTFNVNDSLKSGIISDEYDLYRFSSLYQVIKETMYPINDNFIYCPDLIMIKNYENKNLNEYNFSALLSIPVRNPVLLSVKNDATEIFYNNKKDEEKMLAKINNIFQIAEKQQYDCLLLTDYGCRNECNPTERVIEFFNKCLNIYKIKYVFFCITDKNNFNLFNKLINRF